MRACEELVGRPKYHVMISQRQAPIKVAKITWVSITDTSIMPFPMVLATWRPKNRKAIKLKKAAHMTARRGERTRVETMVAMEFAESWKPFKKSKARASIIRAMIVMFIGLAYLIMIIFPAMRPRLLKQSTAAISAMSMVCILHNRMVCLRYGFFLFP
jgi:hypothetical protein